MPVFSWIRLDIVFLVGRTITSGVFWSVCDLIMILSSLCANVWGCVPVLLVVWHRVSSTVACWSLSGDRLALRWRSQEELLPFDITWNWGVSGGPVT